ncbi:acetylcholine receptor subunit alpha-like [Condylostylus longicornis]|uniref:acetylcholine receptor subunit alpha-like n=1 Tax=Condylostylus longicornis TaxID=2530218 RepID=UPI00244DA1ED|nr:acetylcholine receptor subunit alpha-like [Condylostylus longicornis]
MFKLFKYILCFILIGFYSVSVVADESSWITSEESLRKALLSNYIQTVIPVENHTHPINVNVALIVNHIDISDIDTKAILHGSLDLQWNDNKLQWNPNDFGGLNSIYLTKEKLWVPDLSLYNTANGILLNIKHEGTIKLSSNGKIHWTPHVKLETYCRLSLKYWPFDKQTCPFILGSWVHSSRALIPYLSENRPILDILANNHNWKITNTHSFIEEKIYACCPDPYPSITFTFDLDRKSPMLVWLIITIISSIILMCLAAFWIPPCRGEKILLNGIALLLNGYCIKYFIEKLPNFSQDLPLIITIQVSTFILLTISVIVSIILLRISSNSCGNGKINQGFNRILRNKKLNQILCLPYRDEDGIQKDQTELKDHFEDGKSADSNLLIKKQQNLGNSENDGLILAIFIDRIFFYIYIIIFLILILVCFI